EAHNAAADVNATARSFMELLRIGVFKRDQVKLSEEEFEAFKEINSEPFQPFDIEIEDQVKSHKESTDGNLLGLNETAKSTTDAPYFHFHNHTSFSILTATTSVEALIQKAIEENMPAVGMTDMGNLMGAFKFVSAAKRLNAGRENPIVPILGCEVYVSENYTQNKFTKDNPDRR